MERKDNLIIFDSVIFNKDDKTIEILDGTKGIYSYKDIVYCEILNEKAKYHNKEKPFYATVPNGPLSNGILSERSFYVGIKITMKDDSILAIYISKKPTRINTDLDIKDKKEAKEIKRIIDSAIKKYQ